MCTSLLPPYLRARAHTHSLLYLSAPIRACHFVSGNSSYVILSELSPDRSPVGCGGAPAIRRDATPGIGADSRGFCDRSMNPLCCIAPVSVEKDPAVVKSRTLSQELVVDGNCLHESVSFNNSSSGGGSDAILQPVSFNSRWSLSTNGGAGGGDLQAEKCDESEEIKSVAGILYKWVNYGKGWRERWFVLEDGVLSYYKVHGRIRLWCVRSGKRG